MLNGFGGLKLFKNIFFNDFIYKLVHEHVCVSAISVEKACVCVSVCVSAILVKKACVCCGSELNSVCVCRV